MLTNGEALAGLMDGAASRVLAGTERPYEVAVEAAATLAFFDQEGHESRVSTGAYIHWIEITDLLDAPGGPESEELCNAVAAEFSGEWLALVNRDDELVQASFLKSFHDVFKVRLAEYRDSH